MYWREELAFRITPKGGPLRVMETLLDANRAITQDMPKAFLKKPHWQNAGWALYRAAETGDRADILVATELLVLAVETEDWMSKRSSDRNIK